MISLVPIRRKENIPSLWPCKIGTIKNVVQFCEKSSINKAMKIPCVIKSVICPVHDPGREGCFEVWSLSEWAVTQLIQLYEAQHTIAFIDLSPVCSLPYPI